MIHMSQYANAKDFCEKNPFQSAEVTVQGQDPLKDYAGETIEKFSADGSTFETVTDIADLQQKFQHAPEDVTECSIRFAVPYHCRQCKAALCKSCLRNWLLKKNAREGEDRAPPRVCRLGMVPNEDHPGQNDRCSEEVKALDYLPHLNEADQAQLRTHQEFAERRLELWNKRKEFAARELPRGRLVECSREGCYNSKIFEQDKTEPFVCDRCGMITCQAGDLCTCGDEHTLLLGGPSNRRSKRNLSPCKESACTSESGGYDTRAKRRSTFRSGTGLRGGGAPSQRLSWERPSSSAATSGGSGPPSEASVGESGDAMNESFGEGGDAMDEAEDETSRLERVAFEKWVVNRNRPYDEISQFNPLELQAIQKIANEAHADCGARAGAGNVLNRMKLIEPTRNSHCSVFCPKCHKPRNMEDDGQCLQMHCTECGCNYCGCCGGSLSLEGPNAVHLGFDRSHYRTVQPGMTHQCPKWWHEIARSHVEPPVSVDFLEEAGLDWNHRDQTGAYTRAGRWFVVRKEHHGVWLDVGPEDERATGERRVYVKDDAAAPLNSAEYRGRVVLIPKTGDNTIAKSIADIELMRPDESARAEGDRRPRKTVIRLGGKTIRDKTAVLHQWQRERFLRLLKAEDQASFLAAIETPRGRELLAKFAGKILDWQTGAPIEVTAAQLMADPEIGSLINEIDAVTGQPGLVIDPATNQPTARFDVEALAQGELPDLKIDKSSRRSNGQMFLGMLGGIVSGIVEVLAEDRARPRAAMGPPSTLDDRD
jgi:hypothetical protein